MKISDLVHQLVNIIGPYGDLPICDKNGKEISFADTHFVFEEDSEGKKVYINFL